VIDLAKLENRRGPHARCPACAANGHDRWGTHLYVADDGKFGCAMHPGDADHRKEIFARVGVSDARPTRRVTPLPNAAPVAQAKREVLFPALRRPTCTELAQIQISRNFPFWSPLEYLVRAGMLFTATLRDGVEIVEVWILADSARRNAQARRLDGKPWVSIGAKAKTLPGSNASWPVGAAVLPRHERPVFLCEGGPDALAVEILAWLAGEKVQVVAMLGAGNRIHADALPLFRGRRIRIVEQNDAAALAAGNKWARQLHDAGARVDGWNPPPGVKDVADLLAGFAPQDDDPIADLERAAEGTELFKGLVP